MKSTHRVRFSFLITWEVSVSLYYDKMWSYKYVSDGQDHRCFTVLILLCFTNSCIYK